MYSCYAGRTLAKGLLLCSRYTFIVASSLCPVSPKCSKYAAGNSLCSVVNGFVELKWTNLRARICGLKCFAYWVDIIFLAVCLPSYYMLMQCLIIASIKWALQHFFEHSPKCGQSVTEAPWTLSTKYYCTAHIREFAIWFQDTDGKCLLLSQHIVSLLRPGLYRRWQNNHWLICGESYHRHCGAPLRPTVSAVILAACVLSLLKH